MTDAIPLRTALRRGEEPPDEPPPPGGGGPDFEGLLEHCPVVPLGHAEGVYWFSDGVGQVRRLTRQGLGVSGVVDLFGGRTVWLKDWFPLNSKRGNDGWNNVEAAAFLVEACVREGFFDPDRVRGPGIWPAAAPHAAVDEGGDDPRVVVHCGDVLVIADWDEGGRLRLAGKRAGTRVGDYVYKTTGLPEPRPAKAPADPDDVAALHRFVCNWTWRRGDDDAWLFLGGAAAGFVPALLPYRPVVLLEGDSGVGKSALFSLLRGLYGRAALAYENTTAAHLRDKLAATAAARAVIVNELESREDNRRAAEIVELFRYSYTRGEGGWGRGGTAGGEGRGADVMAFLGAITPPPADAQDANRRVVLRLDPLQASEADIALFDERLAEMVRLGPALRTRMLAQWPRYGATFAAYRRALIRHGHSARGGATWGTVLACADLLLCEQAPTEAEADLWALKLAAERLALDSGLAAPEHERLWSHLLTSRVERWQGGERAAVNDVIAEALEAGEMGADLALQTLKRYGLTLTAVAGERWLAVADKHSGLNDLFRGTAWAGGAWVSLLGRLPGAQRSPSVIRFGRQADSRGARTDIREKAWLLPLAALPGGDLPDDPPGGDAAGPAHGIGDMA